MCPGHHCFSVTLLEGDLPAYLFQGDKLLLGYQTSTFSSCQPEPPEEILVPWGRSLNGLRAKGKVFIKYLSSWQAVTFSTGSAGARAATAPGRRNSRGRKDDTICGESLCLCAAQPSFPSSLRITEYVLHAEHGGYKL